MKRILALMLVAVSVACLQAAPERTVSSQADGIEKVVQITAPQINIEVADFNAAPSFSLLDVPRDARAIAVTKVADGSPAHWKAAAYRVQVVETSLICAVASQPPTAPPGPDNPASVGFVKNTARPAWHMPAPDNPGVSKAAAGQVQEMT
ncbi:MAG: hypothetical protein QG568_108 [Patescibacteria group bacterium]|nr:hypothetical protein [Patescibacteria group bacterium]